MPEVPQWTPEDSQAFERKDYGSDEYKQARNKWKEMNEDAIDRGAATELPQTEIPDRPYTSYHEATKREHELNQEVADLEHKNRTLAGRERLEDWGFDRIEKDLDFSRADHAELQQNLERARRWASTLQQARERGVEIPEQYSRADKCIYRENALAEMQRRNVAYELGSMEFRAADENKDGEAVREALKRFPEVEDVGGYYRLKVDWDGIRQLLNRIQHIPEGEQVKAVLDKARPDNMYVADIEDYRDLVEINDILLPWRRQGAENIAAELSDFKQKVGFTEPEPTQPDAS